MIYQLLSIEFDVEHHCVRKNGEHIHLTNIEFALLKYLLTHIDTVCKREEILDKVWGQRFQYDTGTIDVHLHSLRRKLGFSREYPIESIRGIGVILHSTNKKQTHSINIQDFAIQWIRHHREDFAKKQLTPFLRLDPFVSEITISENDLGVMLDGILTVLLPIAKPGYIHIASRLTMHYFSLSLDVNGTINELKIPLI